MATVDTAGLAALIGRLADCDGSHETAVPGLILNRSSHPTPPAEATCGMALCVVAQGRKRTMLAGESYDYDPARFLLVSLDLPLIYRIVEASPETPYLSATLHLDRNLVGDVLMELDATRPAPPALPTGRGLAVSDLPPPLVDAVTRLIGLLETPDDVDVLAPLVLREVVYRLLVGEQGPRLRQIAVEGGFAQRIALAVDSMRRDFVRPLRIEDVARSVHMSPSAFHQHFKAVTAMSPLQYQKRLRLQEARRLMLADALDAATASRRVGYESPSQFSREYRRLFGEPPSRDIARLREPAAAG